MTQIRSPQTCQFINTSLKVRICCSAVRVQTHTIRVRLALRRFQSVYRCRALRAGRSDDRIPVGQDFPPVQNGPGAHPASCTMGTGSFPGVKYGRGVLLTTHPLLVPRSWKSIAIPLPTLWATPRPVTGTLNLLPLYRRSVAFIFGVKHPLNLHNGSLFSPPTRSAPACTLFYFTDSMTP